MNHREPLCGTPFPQLAPDRRCQSYRFSFGEVMRSLPGHAVRDCHRSGRPRPPPPAPPAHRWPAPTPTLLRRRIIPGAVGLARLVVVVGPKLDPARPWHQPPHPTDRRHQLGTVSWGRDRIGQDGGVQHPPTPPGEHPVASTTWRTAPKTAWAAARSAAGCASTPAPWVEPLVVRRSPKVTFQATSRRSALLASRSDRPSSACSTTTVAAASVGTDG
jgi:hypothetical protein